MVNVTHDGNNGRPFLHIIRIVGFLQHRLVGSGGYKAHIVTKLIGNHYNGFSVEALVDRYDNTQGKAFHNDFANSNIHQSSQFPSGDKFGEL